jgi:hypothetical protein
MPVGGCFRKSIDFAGVGPLAPKFGGTEPFLGVYLCDRLFENGNVFGNYGLWLCVLSRILLIHLERDFKLN